MKNKLVSAVNYVKTIAKSVCLFKNIWKENTTMLVHGKREADKTAEALDIAVNLSKQGRKVIYVDTQSRLADHTDRLAEATDMLILRPCYESPEDRTDYADLVISSIEEAIVETGVKIFVVDSVTRIAALSFGRNASAAYVMKRLVALQVRYGISLLVISHDTTRAADRALINLADSELTVDLPSADAPKQQPADAPTASVHTTAEVAAAPVSEPAPTVAAPRMTRQQRRALERKQRKEALRKRS